MGKLTADFSWRKEDILDLYGAPYAPKRPVVCFDERPLQLLAEVYAPWPAAPKEPRRVAGGACGSAAHQRGLCGADEVVGG